jgi:hypothetical protein
VALVGKYITMPDAYMSVTESLRHAGFFHGVKVDVKWVSSETLEQGDLSPLDGVDGILVPGGFGHRGIEGKIEASRFARRNKVPYLGLCLGMQCAVVGFARDVLDAPDANSTEFNFATAHPVIDLLPEQRDVADKGGTMRLGLYPCTLQPRTRAQAAYDEKIVYERHRWRPAGWSSPVSTRPRSWSRSSSSRITPSSSPPSSTLNSGPAPTSRTRCSASSSRRPAPRPASSRTLHPCGRRPTAGARE